MRETNILERLDKYDDASIGRNGSTAMMPCHVEFSILDNKQNIHNRSGSLSSSCTDSIDFLIEGIDIDDNYGEEYKYSREQDDISPYSCGKTFIIHKQSKDETLGIELGKAAKYGGVFVIKIEPESKFAYTGLKPGMQILSINDRPCPVDFRTVAYIMKETVGDLKISAIDSTKKKNMAKAIQNRQAHRQQKHKQHKPSSQAESIKTKESFGSARTWSPGTNYAPQQADQRQTRDSDGNNDVEERSAASQSSSSKLLASPRALATGGARLMSHWMRSKRYQKIKEDTERSSGRSSRRLTRRYSSREEHRKSPEDDCSTDGLLERIPSALALESIVQEELEANAPSIKVTPLASDDTAQTHYD